MTEPTDGSDEPEEHEADVEAEPAEQHGHRAEQRHFPFGIDP